MRIVCWFYMIRVTLEGCILTHPCHYEANYKNGEIREMAKEIRGIKDGKMVWTLRCKNVISWEETLHGILCILGTQTTKLFCNYDIIVI